MIDSEKDLRISRNFFFTWLYQLLMGIMILGCCWQIWVQASQIEDLQKQNTAYVQAIQNLSVRILQMEKK